MKNSLSIYEHADVYGSAEKYEQAQHRMQTMLQIIERLPLKKKARVLDVGCGTAYFAWLIKQAHPNFEVFGTDVSHHAIRVGRKEYPSIDLRVSDSEKTLPFADRTFDLIISGEHIAHIKNTDLYFSEISRVLKPRGYLLLTTPNLSSWINRVLAVFGRAPFYFEPLLTQGIPVVSVLGIDFPDPGMAPSGHLRLFNLDILKKVLPIFKLTIEKRFGVSALNKPSIKWLDLLMSKVPDLASGIIVLARKK